MHKNKGHEKKVAIAQKEKEHKKKVAIDTKCAPWAVWAGTQTPAYP